MDPAEFGISTLPLQHSPYPAISAETLSGANKGKVAVVTGAGRGIGAAIAESLAKSGADVAILDLTVENLAETKAACKNHVLKVQPYACDVSDEATVRDVFEAIEKELGPIE
jgi:NAD(P)-dependent dehydrogenase (short-subunit alcohol dehydrogenase family)